jgi:hypothetical protein
MAGVAGVYIPMCETNGRLVRLCATQDVACEESRVEPREVKWTEVCFGDAHSPLSASLPAKQSGVRACYSMNKRGKPPRWHDAESQAERRNPPETSYPSMERAHVTQRTAMSRPSRNCYTVSIYTNEQDIYFGLPPPRPISTCSHFHINLIHLPSIYSFVRLRFSPQAMVTSV